MRNLKTGLAFKKKIPREKINQKTENRKRKTVIDMNNVEAVIDMPKLY